MSKPTAEELAKQKQENLEQIEKERQRIVSDFEELGKILTEKGYDQQTYKADATVNVDSALIVKMSVLIAGIQDRLEKVNEVYMTSQKYVNDMLGLAALELLDMHNDMARIHIKACEDGDTVSHEELDKEDAKHKVQKGESKIIKQNTDIIAPE